MRRIERPGAIFPPIDGTGPFLYPNPGWAMKFRLTTWVIAEVRADEVLINLEFCGDSRKKAISSITASKSMSWKDLESEGWIALQILILPVTELKKKQKPILQGSVMNPHQEDLMTTAKQKLATIAIVGGVILAISIMSIVQALASIEPKVTAFCTERPWTCYMTPAEIVREGARMPVAKRNGGLIIAKLVPDLAAKVSDIITTCGSKLISGYRPGAKVAHTNRPSLHSTFPARAADVRGNPTCIYAMLHNWPGGYSTDYNRVRHVHLSYSPPNTGYLAGREWGSRFVHGGHHRYAHVRAHRQLRG